MRLKASNPLRPISTFSSDIASSDSQAGNRSDRLGGSFTSYNRDRMTTQPLTTSERSLRADEATQQILIFLHIPKTAGTSLRTVLREQYADTECRDEADLELWDGILYDRGEGFLKPPGDLIPPYVATALEHHDVRAVFGHFSFGVHRHARRATRYLTFLRDPVDRVTSLYFHLKAWPRPGLAYPNPSESDRPFTDETTLEEFVTNYTLRELDNDQTRRVAGIEPPFGECTRELLDVTKRNIEEQFAVVGLTERFEESVALASHVLGWSSELVYWQRLVNNKRAPASAISPAAREAILARNELDRELYRFAQDRLQKAIEDVGPRFEERLQAIRQV